MFNQKIKTINLALQGGGSHSAFTWGVLDRLLDEKNLQIEGISGTSGGALNGAMLLQGYADGGAKGAKKALDQFWRRIGNIGVFGKNQRSVVDQMLGNWNIDTSPGTMMLDVVGRMFSPYQMNPMNINPLHDLLSDMIDVKKVKNCAAFKFFVATTNVTNGHVRVFSRDEITIDVLMASACLPFTFQAIDIDGIPYWDGGFSGNPAIFPLIYNCQSQDVAVIQLIPISRPGTPSTPSDIMNRLDEISFNTSLVSEMRAIAFVQKLIDEGRLKPGNESDYRRMNIHIITDEERLLALGPSSKMNTDMDFLLTLRDMGARTADQWLKDNWSSIGERSSVDIRAKYL